MKKMKKFFAVLLAMVMVVAMATGCSKKGASKTGGDAAGNSASTKVSLKYEGEKGKMDLTLISKAAGKNASISLSGNADIEDVKSETKADDLIVIANDKLYLNVKAVVNVLSGIEDAKETVDTINGLIDSDYLYMDMDGISDAIQTTDVKAYTELIDSLMAAYKGISSGTDDKVVIKVTSADDIKAFTEATSKFLKDNADKIADYIMSSYNKVDMEKLVDTVVDAIVDSMTDAYEELGMSLTDEQKKQMKDAMKSEMDISELEVNKEDIVSGINELAESFEGSLDVEDVDFDDITFEVTIEKLSTGYKANIIAKNDENSLELSSEIDTTSSVKISAPSKAQNVNDIISGIMAAFGSDFE